MATQSEYMLEVEVLAQLQKLGYNYVKLNDEASIISNLKQQLELHNNVTFSATEFNRVMNILNKGTVFEKAKTLRERKHHIIRDNGDNLYFQFIDTENWCQNRFQVTNQVTIVGKYKNRYDVTLLMNGIPVVQLELKRRGLELKEAFNQTDRYQRNSYGHGSALFHYLQVFVISNGVNTKYYANFSKEPSFKQTFYWTDKNNKRITNILEGFAQEFLEPCHISKMICKYIVLSESTKSLMILRPYQYYAVEAIVDRVKNTNQHGYIWHTTGSGKTLTSFKTSQILKELPDIKKVVFVVDRKDLDSQTTKEFNSFSDKSVDGTENTYKLVQQLGSNDTKLIVTTIQKLNTAISKPQYLSTLQKLKDEKMVFIFDECHRSQFGDTHKNITRFFNNIQMFGFTGTPIFADNAVSNEAGKRTTKDLFTECLHKYVITDAIRDDNVLKFSIEYVGRYKQKEGRETSIDIEVEDINTDELMESPQRLQKIADYILAQHNRKTHSRQFTAMFCVSSVDTLIKYYDMFRHKKQNGEHDLKVATIFSYGANQDPESLYMEQEEYPMAAEPAGTYKITRKDYRDKLEEYISHYNEMFGSKFSTKDSESFDNYYKDISAKVKDKQVDILLVVNMFLTGFDSKTLNTLYVDKNLKYHGLIQAYSRTNRILNELKSQGNIVAFRNLKPATDEAITLFSNKDAIEVIIMQPYEDYVAKFNEAYQELVKITPTVVSVDLLESEEQKLLFVQAFRNLIRIKNIISAFSDFKWDDLDMCEQEFADYQSKYLDLYNRKPGGEKTSILDDVDFEIELIHRDEINVTYILQLLVKLKSRVQADVANTEKEIFNLLGTEITLRSKRELIERFIQENLPLINDADNIPEEFEKFWRHEQNIALSKIIDEEGLSPDETNKLISNYLFTEHEPIVDDVIKLLKNGQPKVSERRPTAERIKAKIVDYTQTFIMGMPIITA